MGKGQKEFKRDFKKYKDIFVPMFFPYFLDSYAKVNTLTGTWIPISAIFLFFPSPLPLPESSYKTIS
jgi:hypothetical protein